MFTDKSNAQKLIYTIHDYSSISSSFKPENIMVDEPSNPNSRWTTTSNDHNQYITLKLHNDSIVTSITFGKFQKLHVCNIKSMKIYSYTSDDDNFLYDDNETNIDQEMISLKQNSCPAFKTIDNPSQIFNGGLKNDSMPETFPLKYIEDDMFTISRYIKICPVQAWGINFNYSLWFVRLDGFERKDIMLKCRKHNYFYLTQECYKIVNNFLRENKNYKTLQTLKKEREFDDEPYIKEKMRSFIEADNFEELENLMCQAVDDGIIDRECYPVGIWTHINEYGPEERGGHAMAFFGSQMFIHGGWNGKEEIGDMWVFESEEKKWRCIKTVHENRSCHKMILYPKNNDSLETNNFSLLLLGRYVQMNLSRRMQISKFDLESETIEGFDYIWEVENIFDHQDVYIDDKLHIFGGKVFLQNQIHFGAFYALEGNEFKRPNEKYANLSELKGRIGHSIIYFRNENYQGFEKFCESECNQPRRYINRIFLAKRNLLLIGGVREKQIFRNITFINLDTDTAYKLVDFPIETENKVVHRTVLIGERIFFMFCFENNKHKIIDRLECYIYHIYDDTWTKIKTVGAVPSARSAHSFGYCEKQNKFYMFGGNTGNENSQKRLNDLWSLEVLSINNESLKSKIKFEVRKHKFLRLKNEDKKAAIEYLQNDVYNVVNHRCAYDVDKFKKLVLEVYKTKTPYKTQEIIDDLSKYFINDLKPATTSLTHCIFK